MDVSQEHAEVEARNLLPGGHASFASPDAPLRSVEPSGLQIGARMCHEVDDQGQSLSVKTIQVSSNATSRDPTSWLWKEVLEYSRKPHVNSGRKLQELITNQRLTGRLLIQCDKKSLRMLAGGDREIYADIKLLSHRLKQEAKHTSSIQPRSPILQDLFSE
ncbi:uncharacterized protein LAESUDRAFT_752084 [Laetiporus sulphureus 93-53]|uniref:Uncharacterized protein n=1 Tax=Laetiporus sulphureus 93-53 TaxID=1314785 RepID=A0A165CCS5_9APHY|nr:uncharacterized protein LAESUDRAFT_752084 [Laetiporus sulphureus 93-53]KZT02576.1 hypothetical protein LAESUDRAFT_752084 [Laetiporus sulphureus 93-53]